MKIRFSSILLVLILLYGINYFIFERVLFFNELLSLIGFIYFLRISLRQNWKLRVPDNSVYRLVMGFLFLGLFYSVVSLFLKTNWYYYFRHLSIVYSVFAFFLGYSLYEAQYSFYSRLRGLILGYGLLSFAMGKFGWVDRSSFAYWLSIIQRRWQWVGVLGFLFLLGLYFAAFTSLTVIIIAGAVMGVLIVPRYTHIKWISLAAFLGFCILFYVAIPYLKLYNVNKEWFFGDVEYVYRQHPWFNFDQNSSWRMIFWYRTLVEAFPGNLLGLGFGTPILPYHPDVTTTDLGYPDEYIAHVIGTHNTFVTIFVRLGLVSVVLFLLIYRAVFRDFFKYKHYYLNHRNDGGLFIGFVIITIVGFFNLVLESPTMSGLYWISLGFVARAMAEPKNYELPNLRR
ncbi:MAG: O-antigen ligase family protein [Cyclobacteriaceae bacterium]|nr:O-antigen ligase family protein [Cyclobacteriaceae bacterium]